MASLDKGQSEDRAAAELWGQPLWWSNVPDWARDGWQITKSALLLGAAREERWHVWTVWYEARLNGTGPFNAELEKARILEIEEEDWEKGPAHVNGLIEEIEGRFKVPIAASVEIDRSSGDITARPVPERAPVPDDRPLDALVARHSGRISVDIVRLRDGENNAPFQMLWPALDRLEEVLTSEFDAEDWHDELDGTLLEIRLLKQNGDLPRRAPEVERLSETLDRAAFAIKDRFPRLALAEDGRRAQRMRQLEDAEVKALETALEAFADVVDAELRQIVKEDVDAAREAEASPGVDDNLPIPEGRLKIRLYRLRGTFLRIRALARTSGEKLVKIFDKGVDAAKKVEAYRKLSETLDKIWDVVRDWFISGGPPGSG